ncbi:type II 3-dehydroquinate dehydratase [Hominifimenecus sp. rT4P-3]|uniref:type II 3-dehydroquinate dehydratase n=1 Tax=Hominifimenecus sp. rT4P-3 TaxID=3242979 RepID=UPI003DA4FF37
MKKILMLHGVNANMFQFRNPEFYGSVTLDQVNARMQEEAKELGVSLECFQSNHAGDLVDKLHQAFFDQTDAVIINPGGFTNCDCGIKEALALLRVPVIEVHMANLFRKKNGSPQGTTTQVATAVLMGMQIDTYPLALRAAVMLADGKDGK